MDANFRGEINFVRAKSRSPSSERIFFLYSIRLLEHYSRATELLRLAMMPR
jgi:hypothetical protein